MGKHRLIETIEEEHDRQRELQDALSETEEVGERRDLLRRFADELLPHMKAEEEAVFPPLIAKGGEEKDSAMEMIEEHRLERMWLEEVRDADPSDDVFTARMKVMIEQNDHHMEEEEEEVLGALEEDFSDDELDGMYTRYQEVRKAEEARLKS